MTANDRTSMQEKNLRNLLKTGAFRFVDEKTPWFPYTSGQVGPYYVQSICIEKDGDAYACAIRSLVELIRVEAGPFDVIGGGETRDWDFSNPVAVMMNKPHAKMYKDGRLIGADVTGRMVAHVADLNNEGSSVRDYWKPIIERNGGRITSFFSFVDRIEEGFALFKSMALPCHSVVPLDAGAWDIVLAEGIITASLHMQLVKRMKDSRGWAIKALLDNPGYFAGFMANVETRPKALKIIRTYPEITEKLTKAGGNHAH